jgi:multidrug resistance efflux pump
MWFVSRHRHNETLRERDGLQDRLFRANTAMRKLELERDQAKNQILTTHKQLESALQEVSRLEALLQDKVKTSQERDQLLSKLHAIKEIVSHLPGSLKNEETAGHASEPTTVNGMG